jgi:hypothetical protein
MSAVSRIYINTNWETFISPYYDSENDKVYFCKWTDVTSLKSGETWNQYFEKYKDSVKEFFKSEGYATTKASLEQQKKPEIKFPVFEKDEKEVCKLDSSVDKDINTNPIIVPDRATIDPRPSGVVKLLYVINEASAVLNIEKIQQDWDAYVQKNGIPPAISAPIKEEKDFSVENYKDLKKIKNISELKDANDFLGATLLKSRNALMASKMGIADPRQVANVQFADAAVQATQKSINANSVSVSNESLSASRVVIDGAQGSLNFLTTTSTTLKAYGFENKASELQNFIQKSQGKLNWAFGQANKWGLMGLLECALAQLISDLEAAGDVETARKLFLELERLMENSTEIKFQWDEYKKIFEKGVSGGIGNVFTKSTGQVILDELQKVGWESLKQVIQLATQACLVELASNEDDKEEDYKFGDIGPDIFNDNMDKVPSLPSNFDSSDTQGTGTDGSGKQPLPPIPTESEINAFLESILDNLTKKELCRLFQGIPDNKLLMFIMSVVQKHPALKPFFPDQQSVSVYFFGIGKQIDLTFCKPSKSPITPNNNLVSYCGSKINNTLADLYKEKLPDSAIDSAGQTPYLPKINIDDLKEALSPDFFQNMLPALDSSQVIGGSYRTAQEDLFSYESLFNKDISNKIEAAAQKTTKNLTETQRKNQNNDLEEVGLEPAGKSGKESSKNDGSLGLEQAFTDVIEEITIPPFQQSVEKLISSEKTSGNKEFTLFKEGGPFNAVYISSKGDFEIESQIQLPYQGMATKVKKSPLTLIGEFVKDSVPQKQTQDPAFFVIGEDLAGTPFTVTDFYRDVVARVVQFYLDELEKRVDKAISNPTELLEFYRIQRRKRINDVLCDAKTKTSEAQEYLIDENRAMDVESIRILIYMLIIERHINQIVLASSGLPKSATGSIFKMLPDDMIKQIAADFTKLCQDSIIDIPVRTVMCNADLSIEEIIKEEMKFVQDSGVSVKALKPIQEVLAEKMNLSQASGKLIFKPSKELQKFIKNYVGKGEPINAAEDTEDVTWQDLWKDVADDGTASIKAKSFVFLMLSKAEGNYNKEIEIDLGLIPQVQYLFITILWSLVVNDKFGYPPTAFDQANKIKSLLGYQIPGLQNSSDEFSELVYDASIKYVPEFGKAQGQEFDIFNFKTKIDSRFTGSSLEVLIDSKSTLTEKFEAYKNFKPEQIVGNTKTTVESSVEKLTDAFNLDFLELLLSYFLYEYGQKEQKMAIFDQTKAAIIARFSVGTPVAVTYDQKVADYETQVNKLLDAKNLTLKTMTTKPFWLIILMIIPIVVFEMLKAIILAAIYFSNPIVYFALMMAQSFGLSLEDYLNKEKKKALKKIEEGLTPGSPEHTAVKKQIEELEKEEEQDSSIIELKCQIPPKNTN